jgi:hypothetical protein
MRVLIMKILTVLIAMVIGSIGYQGASFAAPTVTDLTISWPDDGWYQVQDQATYTEVCGGGRSCSVEPGTYVVINHSTGERFNDIKVVGDGGPSTGVTVTGLTISWPDDGWYQVQDQATYTEVCGGGRSCSVEPGTYVVINHSTGERFNDIKVVGDGGPSYGVAVTGNTISWPDDGWYQVQDQATYTEVCAGGRSCSVEPGTYVVINHSTGERFNDIVVDPDRDEPVITADAAVPLLDYLFRIYTGREYGADMLALPGYDTTALDAQGLPPEGEERIESVTCENGGTLAYTLSQRGTRQITTRRAFDFDDCQDGARVFNGEIVESTFGNIILNSPGLEVTEQQGDTGFYGVINYKYNSNRDGGPRRNYWLSDVRYTVDDGTERVTLGDASIRFNFVIAFDRELEGGYTIASPRTAGRTLEVRTLEALLFRQDDDEAYIADGSRPESTRFRTGTLQVVDANGDSLTLFADNGDPLSADIEIVNASGTERIVLPWSVWAEALEFDFGLLQ